MKARCLQSVLHLLVAVVIAWIHVLTNGATHQEVVLMGCLKGTTRLRLGALVGMQVWGRCWPNR